VTAPAGAGSVGDVRRSLEAARRRAGLSDGELWLAYFGLGGDASPEEMRAYLTEGGPLASGSVDILVQALNEHFMDHGLGMPVPYQER
jgi:non-ribosomal peptide synthetase component F